MTEDELRQSHQNKKPRLSQMLGHVSHRDVRSGGLSRVHLSNCKTDVILKASAMFSPLEFPLSKIQVQDEFLEVEKTKTHRSL